MRTIEVHSLPIVTGADLHGQVIVRQGLAGSETLVNNPPQKLKDGDAVKVKSVSVRKLNQLSKGESCIRAITDT